MTSCMHYSYLGTNYIYAMITSYINKFALLPSIPPMDRAISWSMVAPTGGRRLSPWENTSRTKLYK